MKQYLEFPLTVVRKFRTDRLLRHASALSYSSLLALAPMVAIGFAMISIFSGFQELGAELEDYIYRFLVPTAGDDVRAYITQFAGQAGKLTVIGLAFFLLTALLLLNTIEESFNDIWGVEQGRTISQRLTVYWALVSLGPLLMGASLTISTYILTSSVLGTNGLTSQVQSFGLSVLPFMFQWMAFALLYFVMPNARVRFWHGLVGALVATILFEGTKRLFGFYILNFNSYEVVYGALSSLPIFLVWIYLSWVVALVGAEIVSVLGRESSLEPEASKSEASS